MQNVFVTADAPQSHLQVSNDKYLHIFGARNRNKCKFSFAPNAPKSHFWCSNDPNKCITLFCSTFLPEGKEPLVRYIFLPWHSFITSLLHLLFLCLYWCPLSILSACLSMKSNKAFMNFALTAPSMIISLMVIAALPLTSSYLVRVCLQIWWKSLTNRSPTDHRSVVCWW